MLIDFDYKDDVCILRLKGRFVTGGDREYLQAKIDELKNCGRRKVLADFSGVPYADSTGIAFVVGVYTSVTNSLGGRFVLVGPNHRVREVLDLTRLSTVIPVVADEAAGLVFLKGEGPVARSAQE
jgi:anti-anti-sigma factor